MTTSRGVRPFPKSLLFGPANRVDWIAKFVAAGAGAGILDLEDATPESQKEQARQTVASASPEQLDRGDMQLFVRTNVVGTTHFELDVDAGLSAGVDGFVIPMIQSAADLVAGRKVLNSRGFNGWVIAGIESAEAVLSARDICAGGADAVYFGAEDFVTDIGGRRTASNHECSVARSMVVMAATASRIIAIDQVVTDISDPSRFATEAKEAREMGFKAKLCIHPSQVEAANSAFVPTADELAWAEGVLNAAAEAEAEGRGATQFEGSMIDAPVVSRASDIVLRSQA